MARVAGSTLVAAVLLAGAAGCGGDRPPDAPQVGPPAVPSFTNPVYDENFPDPGVLRAGDTYYAYGTNTSAENVPTMTSLDLVSWADGPDALPAVGDWAVGGNTWAPEVLAVAGGRFVLYYTARSIGTGTQCIGRAVGNLVEAPEMVRHGAAHVLFYSANGYDTDEYAMGYATCRTALGPCTDTAQPVLRSTPEAAGPGHGYVVSTPDGGTWLLYHAWPPEAIGSTSPGRQLWLDRLEWQGDRPVVRGPTADAQPAP